MDTEEKNTQLKEDHKRVFEILLRFGPLTKKQIIKYTNMKLTTLNRTMEMLNYHRLITEVGEQESSGGRKPALFNVCSMGYYFLGIDISRTYSKIVIINLKKDILFQEQFEMYQDMTPERTVEKIKDIFNKAVTQLGIKKNEVVGGGIGTIGPLNGIEGVIYKPYNFYAEGWENTPIKNMLKEALEIPIIVDNGANTAVYAEYLSGSRINYDNIVYVNCGIGIRMGVIANGKILRTINNANDAFGHMVVNYDGESCYCGKYGCVECYASILSIENKYISNIKLGRKTTIDNTIENITYMDILKAAENDEVLAKEILEFSANILGVGLKNYVSLVNPELVILSGPLMNNADIFYNMVIDSIGSRDSTIDGQKIIFAKSGNYKENAIAVGAAIMFLKDSLNTGVLIRKNTN